MLERFRSKIVFGQGLNCDEWTGAKTELGYARFNLNGRNQHASRVIWEWTHGPIPSGMHVCHHCDNPKCVKPTHLFLGTRSDNIQDMIRKGYRRELRGEDNHQSKLTVAAVRHIRASRKTNTELARQFGVTRKAVAFVREGQTWKTIK